MASDILKGMDTGDKAEIYQSLKKLSFNRVMRKHNVEESLALMGCTANEILLVKRNDMGMCLMDFMGMDCDMPGILSCSELALTDAIEDLSDPTNREAVADFGENIFKTIENELKKR